MEIEDIVNNVTIYGMEYAVKASKYPMSILPNTCDSTITSGVNSRGKCEAGTGHNNFLLGIIVQFDLTFTIKAWTEMERYHFIDIISSQSTMHRISKMDLNKSCIEYTDSRVIDVVNELKAKYLETQGKEDYLKLLYSCPTGLRLTAGMTTNYLQLKTIYKQRKDHRLPEWRTFCRWLETLPKSEWITGEIDAA